MNKIILFTLITLSLNTSVFADCNQAYQKAKDISATKAALSTTAAAGGAVVAYWGTAIGLFSIGDAAPLTGISTIVGADAPAIFVTVQSVENALEFRSLNKVHQLINESELVFGKQLSETAESLSEELDMMITEEDVAQVITEANQNEIFCGNIKYPYGYKSVFNYLIKELQ